MGQTIQEINSVEEKSDLFPFHIVNIRPDYTAEKALKTEQSVQSELYHIFKKYCR